MPTYLAVKNWPKFQHYRNRRPPWIKLYHTLLEDYNFLSLSNASRGLLMTLWLVASENNGWILYDRKWLAKRTMSGKSVSLLRKLIENGWLLEFNNIKGIDEYFASIMLASCKQSAILEKEIEKEIEKEKNKKKNFPSPLAQGGSVHKKSKVEKPKPNVWAWWIDANREAGRADPVAEGPDLAAAKRLGRLVDGKPAPGFDEARMRKALSVYLTTTDRFIVGKGHSLRYLNMNALLNTHTKDEYTLTEDQVAYFIALEDRLEKEGKGGY